MGIGHRAGLDSGLTEGSVEASNFCEERVPPLSLAVCAAKTWSSLGPASFALPLSGGEGQLACGTLL